ncbi:hypothetical protein TNCV_4659131 [Trichonephila clavipes]|nr:hypothetical protein TNCV_4659131 [Trichonephila clavipes]
MKRGSHLGRGPSWPMPYDVTVHQRTAEIDRVRVYLRHPLNARYNKSYNSRAIANRLLNFESRSKQEEDISAWHTLSKLPPHTNGRKLNLNRFSVHRPPLYGGSSVALGPNL